MMKITDLAVNKELNGAAMAEVRGGFDPRAIINGSTSLTNRVADISQLFDLAVAQQNAGQVTNNQVIQGGNGIVYAPVTQRLDQGNILSLLGLGNTRVG